MKSGVNSQRTMADQETGVPDTSADPSAPTDMPQDQAGDDAPTEIGGRGGLDPTRYGDWEKNGRCIDF